MLKHTSLTVGRIRQFVRYELEERLVTRRAPLEISYCATPHRRESEARTDGPWERVEPGFKYGPAYTEKWFRLQGRAPREWPRAPLFLSAQVGGERTLWLNDQPYLGIDGPHPLAALPKGPNVDVLVHVSAGNAQTTVHRPELPRDPLPETVQGAELVQVDEALQELHYDCEFALSLLEAHDEASPSHACLLRALNGVCNTYEPAEPATIGKCRKLLREALGSIDGGIRHSITPVGHAHLDTAWLWPLSVTRFKMAHTTASQLDLIERYPEYVFVHSQASQYEWLEMEHPKLFERVKAAVKRGQWEPVGSMWVEADCNLSGGEALVRQFLYGRRYFERHFGFPTHDMWLPDVFGYSAALPQILRKFGIAYFLTQKLSWNQFNKLPHNTFLWEGIDGSRLWTHFPPADTYCGDCTPKELLGSVRKHRDHARSDHSLYLFGFGDGGGGPTERHLEMLRRARTTSGMPQLESGRRAAEFFAEARSKSRDLLTWVGELYFEMHRGTYTSQAKTKKGNRECEFLLRDAELLACLDPGFPESYPAAELEELWKLVLLNQFHDILPGSSVAEVYRDAEADYDKVRREADELIRSRLVSAAGRMDLANMAQPVALFQNATVPTLASIPWDAQVSPSSLSIADEALPIQLSEAFGERRLWFVTPDAALGSVAVGEFTDAAPTARYRLRARERRMENQELAVRFDQHGNITSIATLDAAPTEFVMPGKLANLFQIFDDKPLYWSAWDIDAYALETQHDLVRSESFEIVERGPVCVVAEVLKRFGQSTLRQRISLGPTPGIRFDTWVDWRETDKLLKVAFPLSVHSARATFEIQFGCVERPTHRNTSWDVARFEVCAQKWVDVSEGGLGVALLNDCKYGHDVLGNVLRLSLLRSPKAPDPSCDMGEHRFSYVLLPHFDGYQHADVVAAAYALNSPVRHAMIEPGKRATGAGSDLRSGFGVSSRNLVVEAVKKAEDGPQLVVRLYECHNTRGWAELWSGGPLRRAWLCDLNEQRERELEVVDDRVRFEFKPFEILTLMLES